MRDSASAQHADALHHDARETEISALQRPPEHLHLLARGENLRLEVTEELLPFSCRQKPDEVEDSVEAKLATCGMRPFVRESAGHLLWCKSYSIFFKERSVPPADGDVLAGKAIVG
jgi:hypothetical protein